MSRAKRSGKGASPSIASMREIVGHTRRFQELMRPVRDRVFRVVAEQSPAMIVPLGLQQVIRLSSADQLRVFLTPRPTGGFVAAALLNAPGVRLLATWKMKADRGTTGPGRPGLGQLYEEHGRPALETLAEKPSSLLERSQDYQRRSVGTEPPTQSKTEVHPMSAKQTLETPQAANVAQPAQEPAGEKAVPPFRELLTRKTEFQEMMRLLVDYDERTGRFHRYDGAELHYLRKTAALAPPDKLRVYLRQVEPFVYAVVVELATDGARVATAWIHEDGIRAEREVWTDPDHPVHGIVCMTDLFTTDTTPIAMVFGEAHPPPSDFALELMLDHGLFDD
jgi:hypothetical protein